MKTYTLTWRHRPFYGSTLSRCRFDASAVLWPFCLRYTQDSVLAFMYLACIFGSTPYRLSRCGKLVARSATYQGV